MLFGTMKQGAKLLGTSLTLEEGQRVRLTPATNQPDGGWFAAPADGKWSDGLDREEGDSILLTDDDVEIDYFDKFNARDLLQKQLPGPTWKLVDYLLTVWNTDDERTFDEFLRGDEPHDHDGEPLDSDEEE